MKQIYKGFRYEGLCCRKFDDPQKLCDFVNLTVIDEFEILVWEGTYTLFYYPTCVKGGLLNG